jgi:hypothetical protein
MDSPEGIRVKQGIILSLYSPFFINSSSVWYYESLQSYNKIKVFIFIKSKSPSSSTGRQSSTAGEAEHSVSYAAYHFLPALLQQQVNLSKVLPASSHGVVHHLRMTGLPIVPLFQQLDAEQITTADFMKMEAEGIIRRSSSPWNLLFI